MSVLSQEFTQSLKGVARNDCCSAAGAFDRQDRTAGCKDGGRLGGPERALTGVAMLGRAVQPAAVGLRADGAQMSEIGGRCRRCECWTAEDDSSVGLARGSGQGGKRKPPGLRQGALHSIVPRSASAIRPIRADGLLSLIRASRSAARDSSARPGNPPSGRARRRPPLVDLKQLVEGMNSRHRLYPPYRPKSLTTLPPATRMSRWFRGYIDKCNQGITL
jgi:hypothetical protein